MSDQFMLSRDGGNTKLPWTVYKFVTRESGLRYWRAVANFKTRPEAVAYTKSRESQLQSDQPAPSTERLPND